MRAITRPSYEIYSVSVRTVYKKILECPDLLLELRQVVILVHAHQRIVHSLVSTRDLRQLQVLLELRTQELLPDVVE